MLSAAPSLPASVSSSSDTTTPPAQPPLNEEQDKARSQGLIPETAGDGGTQTIIPSGVAEPSLDLSAFSHTRLQEHACHVHVVCQGLSTLVIFRGANGGEGALMLEHVVNIP